MTLESGARRSCRVRASERRHRRHEHRCRSEASTEPTSSRVPGDPFQLLCLPSGILPREGVHPVRHPSLDPARHASLGTTPPTLHALPSHASFEPVTRARRAWPLLTVALTFAPALARADAGADNDVRALEKQLDAEHVALSTSDCNAACRALGSIRRAAERICALEPGPRCDAARSKAADATRRVRDACPDCALASAPQQDAPAPERAFASDPLPAPQTEAAAPRGGCRSCASTESTESKSDLALIVLGVIAGVQVIRRRSKKGSRPL